MKNFLIGILVTIFAIVAVGAGYVAFNYDEIRSQFVGDDGSGDENTDNDNDDEIEADEEPVTEEPLTDENQSTYEFTYDVEAVAYEPDSNYIGFRYCDAQLSVCTVLGVPATDLASVELGQLFTLSYNEIYGYGGGAAAGTSYSQIYGDYELSRR